MARPTKLQQLSRTIENEDWLHEEFVVKGRSANEIADQFHINTNLVMEKVALFGFDFVDKNDPSTPDSRRTPSFTTRPNEDGAIITSVNAFGTYVDLDGSVRNTCELINKYREISLNAYVDVAIEEIVNECLAINEKTLIKINLDDIDISPKIKKIIEDEFFTILHLLGFRQNSYEIFRRWYVDGRLFYHMMIDLDNPKDGIKEIRYIDPRKIQKIREVKQKPLQLKGNASGLAYVTKTENEYYVFNEKGFAMRTNSPSSIPFPNDGNSSGLKIAKDSIVYVVSGLTDASGNMVLSYLHAAIKAVNQLSMLEDAQVIYTLARAPERRIWYVDVGNLPKAKAEQYMREIMVKHKNKLVYDAQSGNIVDSRKFMSMLEDYWLPRREGGRGTDVETLPGAGTLGDNELLDYFKTKLQNTLRVPKDRMETDSLFNVGSTAETTREELRFGLFVTRLRSRFSHLFLQILERQLILKGIFNTEEWNNIKDDIYFYFTRNNYFTELKNSEILQSRLQNLEMISGFIGTFYSKEWVKKNILYQSDEEIKTMEEEMDDELKENPDEMQSDNTSQPSSGGAPRKSPSRGGDDDSGPQLHGDSSSEKRGKLMKAKNEYTRLINIHNKSPDQLSKLQRAAVTLAKSGDPRLKGMLQINKRKVESGETNG